jgi:hypothetical protein
MSAQSKPSIVFAHGLWADGSCFQRWAVVSQTTPGLVGGASTPHRSTVRSREMTWLR